MSVVPELEFSRVEGLGPDSPKSGSESAKSSTSSHGSPKSHTHNPLSPHLTTTSQRALQNYGKDEHGGILSSAVHGVEHMGENAVHSLQENTRDIFHALESNTKNLGFVGFICNYTFDPYGRFRSVWDVVMLLLVFYSSIMAPYEVAFKEYAPYTAGDWLIDLCFYVDIVLNFWTGFDNGYEIITNKKKIAKNYLKLWFWIDFLATIEWDLFFHFFLPGKMSVATLRLTRILKVARIARASRLVNRLTQSLTIHTGFIDAIKFFMYVFIVAHLLACIFYMVPALIDCQGESVEQFEKRMMTGLTLDWLNGDDIVPVRDDWLNGDDMLNSTKFDGCQERYIADENFMTHNYKNIFGDPTEERDGVDLTGLKEYKRSKLADMDPCMVFLKHQDGEMKGEMKKFSEYMKSDQKSERDSRCSCTCLMHSWRDDYALDHGEIDVRAFQKWVIAFYWALTTMTTIGYGDYGPKGHNGTIFVMFAEVLGLAFFALLLTQINRVMDVLGEQDGVANKIKNDITQFMRWNSMDRGLINEVVHFLSFRAGSATGHSMEEDDPRFASLSLALRRKIKIGLFRPVLERVRFFGWSKVDKKEEKQLYKIFQDMDEDESGSLDISEITRLIEAIGLALSDVELKQALDDMDTAQSGVVDFQEFRQWWYFNKYGTLMPTKCPGVFLDELCWIMKSVAVGPGDVVVGDNAPCELGQQLLYGDELIIILTGSLKVIDTKGTIGEDDDEDVSIARAQEEHLNADIDTDEEEENEEHEEIRHVDQSENESMIGMQAVLEPYCFTLAREKTRNWMVKAHTEYSDLLHVDRKTLANLLDNTWPEGRALMRSAALAQYDISEEEAERAKMAWTGEEEQVPDGQVHEKVEFVNTRINRLEEKLDKLISLVASATEST